MGAFSNDLEAKIVDHFLRNTSQTSPTTVYLALFQTNPAEDGSGTETAYTGYARQSSAWTSLNGSGETENTASITFPANGGAQVTITHAAVFDAVSSGNMLIYGVLTASKVLETSDVLSFAAGALVLTLD